MTDTFKTTTLVLVVCILLMFLSSSTNNNNAPAVVCAFQQRQQQQRRLHPKATTASSPSSRRQQNRPRWTISKLQLSSVPSDVSSSPYATLDDLKADLLRTCKFNSSSAGADAENKPSLANIQDLVSQLEDRGEQMGIGQSSSFSGLLAGEWELLYSPEDVTRASPFFWAFAQAFPENADQIFGITDAIPSPLKDVGPVYQTIELDDDNTGRGKLVSRVKVATLNGLATSIMTTRADIMEPVGVDGLRLRIDTTKPEESTAIAALLPGPLGQYVNENAPAFPSGEALEKVMPGSSMVVMRTTYCDDSIRVSRNDNQYALPYVWRRCKFAGSESI